MVRRASWLFPPLIEKLFGIGFICPMEQELKYFRVFLLLAIEIINFFYTLFFREWRDEAPGRGKPFNTCL
jgi:hypothetical protein